MVEVGSTVVGSQAFVVCGSVPMQRRRYPHPYPRFRPPDRAAPSGPESRNRSPIRPSERSCPGGPASGTYQPKCANTGSTWPCRRVPAPPRDAGGGWG
ncbi:hypothetical protein G6F22_019659 [Rhizopus arrhizus]|nr:hypothetical protein G6F22_019659 [Rhizopus arrhizus]KAG1272360.1 hypothetical protein G6F65_011764 [Rhizopus arrhizus]